MSLVAEERDNLGVMLIGSSSPIVGVHVDRRPAGVLARRTRLLSHQAAGRRVDLYAACCMLVEVLESWGVARVEVTLMGAKGMETGR